MCKPSDCYTVELGNIRLASYPGFLSQISGEKEPGRILHVIRCHVTSHLPDSKVHNNSIEQSCYQRVSWGTRKVQDRDDLASRWTHRATTASGDVTLFTCKILLPIFHQAARACAHIAQLLHASGYHQFSGYVSALYCPRIPSCTLVYYTDISMLLPQTISTALGRASVLPWHLEFQLS